jgi:hypothetical protein
MFVTGLIYVAIVALWAAVLVPMWLRRHDDDEAHRLERHQEALGTLARFRSGNSSQAPPAKRAARRRRVILATLVAVTVTGAAAWVLQVAGAWVVLVPGLTLLAFVASAAFATRSMTRPAASTTRRTRDTAARVDLEQHAEQRAEQHAEQRAEQREQRRAKRRERVAASAADTSSDDSYGYPDTRRQTRRREVIITPPDRTRRDHVALEGTRIDQDHADELDTAQAHPSRRRASWEQVFDQTA